MVRPFLQNSDSGRSLLHAEHLFMIALLQWLLLKGAVIQFLLHIGLEVSLASLPHGMAHHIDWRYQAHGNQPSSTVFVHGEFRSLAPSRQSRYDEGAREEHGKGRAV